METERRVPFRFVRDKLGLLPRQANNNREDTRVSSLNTRQVVPPFKPLPIGPPRPMAQQPERQKLVVNSTALKTAPVMPLSQQDALRLQHQRIHQEAKLRQQQRMQQEALALQMLKQQRLQQQEAMRQQHMQKMQQQQQQQQMFAQRQHIMAIQNKKDPVRMIPVVIF